MSHIPLNPPPREINEFEVIWRDWLFYLYKQVQENMNTDFMLEVSAGNVPSHSGVCKFGRNTVIASAAVADIWDNGQTGGNLIWDAPTSAVNHNIVSTSTSDDGSPAGVGARTIQVYGLTDWGSKETSEVITMNGTTNVPTVNSYVIIHRMKVLTKGATSSNVGTIKATAIGGGGLVTAQINVGKGQTQMAICGIPSTQTAYMTHYYASANKAGGTTGLANIRLLVNPEPNTELINFVHKHTQALIATGNSYIRHEYQPYFKIPGPAIIKMQALSGAADMDISAGFDLILVDN